MGILDRIKEVEEEIKRTQTNKATSAHLGRLKAKRAKLRSELLEGSKGAPGGGVSEGFDVKASGDARVAMIGFPSVGKSSLLSTLTTTESLSAAYEFTTLTCVPGQIKYKGSNIQLLDLPGIIEGASENKGRGREVIGVGRNADMILMMLDASKGNEHRAILERELESVGIRLNKRPANIYFVKKPTGGIKITSTVKVTFLDDVTIKAILQEYKFHNCEVILKEDATVDEFVDIVEGNRKYLPCVYAYNKIDCLCLEELDYFARMPDSLVISIHWNLNLDYLLEKLWEYLDLTRVYTKPRGIKPDFSEPVILRAGATVEHVCRHVHKDFADKFKYALVWGTSAKHCPQRVGIKHQLEDEDVIQLMTK